MVSKLNCGIIVNLLWSFTYLDSIVWTQSSLLSAPPDFACLLSRPYLNIRHYLLSQSTRTSYLARAMRCYRRNKSISLKQY